MITLVTNLKPYTLCYMTACLIYLQYHSGSLMNPFGSHSLKWLTFCYTEIDRNRYDGGMLLNTLRPRQNGHHFADGTYKRIFLKQNVIISIKISLKFVPESPIDNIPALLQIMAWRRPGDKPLSEAMKVSLLTRICVAQPQWVNMRADMTNFEIIIMDTWRYKAENGL